jgi:integrase
MFKRGENPNHPKKGSAIKVDPIRRQEDVKAIKSLLQGSPRDLAIFTLGINSALRPSDLLRITVGQVKSLKVGDSFEVREKKTGLYRRVMLNKGSFKAVKDCLALFEDAHDEDWLFRSRKRGKLLVSSFTRMVKLWCRSINMRGNFGGHTLRKTFGYHQRVYFGLGTATLMAVYNHGSERQTLDYLGVERDELIKAHWNEI